MASGSIGFDRLEIIPYGDLRYDIELLPEKRRVKTTISILACFGTNCGCGIDFGLDLGSGLFHPKLGKKW